MAKTTEGDLPHFYGDDILKEAEAKFNEYVGIPLDANATFILGLCIIIRGLRDDVELLERRINELEQR